MSADPIIITVAQTATTTWQLKTCRWSSSRIRETADERQTGRRWVMGKPSLERTLRRLADGPAYEVEENLLPTVSEAVELGYATRLETGRICGRWGREFRVVLTEAGHEEARKWAIPSRSRI